MWLRFLLFACALGGCAAEKSTQPPPTPQPRPAADDDSEYAADGAPLERDPPSEDEAAVGHSFRDIYKPVIQSCDSWSSQIRSVKGACSLELFVQGCGEKDADGHPTGLYKGNACPTCERLARIQQNAKAAGCGE